MISARATRSSAFILTLVLGLLTSVALAQKTDPADKYQDTTNGTVTPGVIKSLKDCPDGTDAFFKNVNPFISGGPGGDPGTFEFVETFLVDGSEVRLFIIWKDDNSFRFKFDRDFPAVAVMDALGAEVDNDKFFYKYPVPVFEDSGLNVLEGGGASADVNHLDLCMSLVDSTSPNIVFISPLNGDTVSGLVTVQVEVTDESGVDPDSVTVSVNGGTPDPMDCGTTQPPLVCSYVWNAEDLPTGPYTIVVSANDLRIPAPPNTGTASVDVQLIKSFTSCFGTLGEEDFAQIPTETDDDGNLIYTGGCNPTGKLLIQAPPDNSACSGDTPPAGCYIDGTLLKPDPDRVTQLADVGDCPAAIQNPDGTAYCGDYGFPDCRMAQDVTGNWYPKYKEVLKVFDSSQPRGVGIHPDLAAGVLAAVQASYPNDPNGPPHPTDLAGELVLDDKTYCANGCCVIAQHLKGDSLDSLYTAWPDTNGLAFIKVHDAKNVLGNDLAADCYDETTNPDLQDAAAVGYHPLFQTEDDGDFVTVLTQECQNPLRDFTRNNGFDVSNIIVSTAGDLPPEPENPDAGGYGDVEAAPIVVLNFMYNRAQDDFDRLFVLLGVIRDDALLLTGDLDGDVASPINQAKARFSNRNTVSLQQSIDALGDAADGIRTKTTYVVVEANPPGEALALVEHLVWELGLIKKELIRLEELGIL